MNTQRQRLESALAQLEHLQQTSVPSNGTRGVEQSNRGVGQNNEGIRVPSNHQGNGGLVPSTQGRNPNQEQRSISPSVQAKNNNQRPPQKTSALSFVLNSLPFTKGSQPKNQPSQPPATVGKLPPLPPLQSANISTHRHSVNPDLVTNLLRELDKIVISWQQELKQVARAIQELYREGPIVDGWLESQTPNGGQQMKQIRQVGTVVTREVVTNPVPRVGYRLCGLDERGRLWSKPCPPEQVPGVSMAIARFQRLRQLLKRKQSLEHRLTDLAEMLVKVHGSIK